MVEFDTVIEVAFQVDSARLYSQKVRVQVNIWSVNSMQIYIDDIITESWENYWKIQKTA